MTEEHNWLVIDVMVFNELVSDSDIIALNIVEYLLCI